MDSQWVKSSNPGPLDKLPTKGHLAQPPGDDDRLLAVSEALDKLATEHKTDADLVKLRYFVGMTNDEAAEVLGVSARSAKYYRTHARAWLFREFANREVS